MASPRTDLPSDTSALDLLAGLAADRHEDLFKKAHVRTIAENKMIYARGDDSSSIFYVVKGLVKIFDITGDGREIIYRMCDAQSLFGLSAIFGGSARPVFAQAQVATKVLVISRQDFEQFVHENPKFSIDVIHMLGDRLRQAHAAIAEFVVGDVRSRIAQLLIKFSESGKVLEGGSIKIANKMTHEEIANMIGATRTTVTKVLGEWKCRGIIETSHSKILVHDIGALTQMIQH